MTGTLAVAPSVARPLPAPCEVDEAATHRWRDFIGQSHDTSPLFAAQAETTAVALLGIGTVGTAFIERMRTVPSASCLRLVHVANSRHALHCAQGFCIDELAQHLRPVSPRTLGIGDDCSAVDVDATLATLGGRRRAIIVDATGCESVAARHAGWLARGVHVVTASKLGQGGSLARWRAIDAACARAGSQYGDSATVGAGLPVLPSLRALRDGGDAILGIAGVMSGSLAWLFSAYDGLRPFSKFVREARESGLTEPDPRDDLSGEDVRRKLLILARTAGFALESMQVDVESLVPDCLAAVPLDEFLARAESLDVPMRERFAAAYKRGEKLRHVARLQVSDGVVQARVGLESLPADDALATGSGTDNRVAIRSERYCAQPLVIQGPGAGAGVTAAALLDDVLRIARAAR